jgi:hydrogenase small subunit
MAQEAHGALNDLLAVRGVSRRDFLKYCGSIAAMLGLSETFAPQIAAAIEGAPKLFPALWLNGGACTGCTESVAQTDYPDVATIVLDYLALDYFETVMAAAGDRAEANIDKMIEENAGGFLLIYEGAVMTGFDGNALRVAGKTGTEILANVASKAAAVISVGSCAVDGGWVRAEPNPAGATGVAAFLAKEGIATPVVNLPTCPVNPEWVVAMVVQFLLVANRDLNAFVEKTKWITRSVADPVTGLTVDLLLPEGIFGQTIHDNCPRRGHFENGEFVAEFGSAEEAMGYCLYQVGCKGPQTFTNCPIVRWNRRASWCVESGSPCIGCGGFNWVDNNAPFFNRLSDVNLGTANIQPGTIGAIVGGVAAAGLIAHGIGSKAAGRTGGGLEFESEKAHDRKKGGGK